MEHDDQASRTEHRGSASGGFDLTTTSDAHVPSEFGNHKHPKERMNTKTLLNMFVIVAIAMLSPRFASAGDDGFPDVMNPASPTSPLNPFNPFNPSFQKPTGQPSSSQPSEYPREAARSVMLLLLGLGVVMTLPYLIIAIVQKDWEWHSESPLLAIAFTWAMFGPLALLAWICSLL